MNQNLLPSDRAAVVAAINPVSQGAGSVSTPWVSVATFINLMAVLMVGALGTSATIDAKFEQATDGSGTDAKDVDGASITQLTQAGSDDSNKQALINLRNDMLDTTNEFTHVRLTVDVGVAASLVGATVLGMDATYQPADQAASVAEVA